MSVIMLNAHMHPLFFFLIAFNMMPIYWCQLAYVVNLSGFLMETYLD